MSSTPFLAVALLDLFEGPLRGIRFPEADGESIAAAAEEVRQAQLALAHAQAALDAARGLLADRQAELTRRAQRTLAYARIYAQDKPELLDAIASVSSNTSPDGAPRKKRGRPRKDAASPAVASAQAAE
ncbi:MAG: hypothetical protein KC657_07050 [Myxococcales bacterium]|nr:hypothetical protein [Myxococcales bacterium]